MSEASVTRPAATGPAVSYPHDVAVTGAILGVAGMAWFGWGQAAAPAGWLLPLRTGSVACLLVAIGSVVTARRARPAASAMQDPLVRRRYLTIVGIEVALIVAGAAVFGPSGHPAYLAPWILFVVGAHFIPLARVFATSGLIAPGVLLMLIAAAAAITGAAGAVAPSTVAGGGGGLVCGAQALMCLIRARSQTAAPAGDGRRPAGLIR